MQINLSHQTFQLTISHRPYVPDNVSDIAPRRCTTPPQLRQSTPSHSWAEYTDLIGNHDPDIRTPNRVSVSAAAQR